MAPRTRSLLDLRFQQFGAYLVLGKGKTTAHGPFWICQCQCNQQVEIHHDALVEGRATHCGCAFGLLPGGKVRVNWVGRHVGQSLVLEPAPNTRAGARAYQVRCLNGHTRIAEGRELARNKGACPRCGPRKPLRSRWYSAEMFLGDLAAIHPKRGLLYHCHYRCGHRRVAAAVDIRQGMYARCLVCLKLCSKSQQNISSH